MTDAEADKATRRISMAELADQIGEHFGNAGPCSDGTCGHYYELCPKASAVIEKLESVLAEAKAYVAEAKGELWPSDREWGVLEGIEEILERLDY